METVDYGEVTSSADIGSNVLQDQSKHWQTDVHKDRLVSIVKGSGDGQQRTIKANIENTLIVNSPWTIALDRTSVYRIIDVEPVVVPSSAGAPNANDGVYIDTTNGVAGTLSPIGSPTMPSNNINDAILIAAALKLTKIYLVNQSTIALTAPLLTPLLFIGTGPDGTETVGLAGFHSAFSEFESVSVSGIMDPADFIIAHNCALITNILHGDYHNCIIILGSLVQAIMHDCIFKNNAIDLSLVPAGNTTQIIGAKGTLSIDGLAAVATIYLWGADLELSIGGSCTAGTINIYGLARVTDNSAGTTVNNFTINNEIEKTLFDAVYMDVTNGAAGTAWPIGTAASPVNNLADALAIGAAHNLRTFKVRGRLVIAQDVTDRTFIGIGDDITELSSIEIQGFNLDGALFENIALIFTTAIATNMFSVKNCQVDMAGGMGNDGVYTNCRILSASIEGAFEQFFNCTFAPAALGASMVGTGANTARLINCHGYINLALNDALTTIELYGGDVTVDLAGAAAGILNRYGTAKLLGAGAGITINDFAAGIY